MVKNFVYFSKLAKEADEREISESVLERYARLEKIWEKKAEGPWSKNSKNTLRELKNIELKANTVAAITSFAPALGIFASEIIGAQGFIAASINFIASKYVSSQVGQEVSVDMGLHGFALSISLLVTLALTPGVNAVGALPALVAAKAGMEQFEQLKPVLMKGDLERFEKSLNRKISLHFSDNFNKLPKELRNNIINGVRLAGYLEAF